MSTTRAEVSELKAKVGTVLKPATEVHSKDLAADQKLEVAAGVVLKGRLTGTQAGYWVVERATVNGEAVPAHIRYLYKNHWELLSAKTDAPPSVATSVAAPLSSDTKDAEIRSMLADGKSVSAIAKTLKIGRARIKRIRDADAGVS